VSATELPVDPPIDNPALAEAFDRARNGDHNTAGSDDQ
jgi:hypothetical protein